MGTGQSQRYGLPTLFDVAEEAGLNVATVGDFYRLKRDERYTDRIAAASEKLGYVNCIYTLKYNKPLEAVVLLGDYDEYLPHLTQTLEFPIIINKHDPQDPHYIFQKYGVLHCIMFKMDIHYEYWMRLERNMIFVDCEEQNVFTSINGFSPELTANWIYWLCRYPRTSPINIRAIE